MQKNDFALKVDGLNRDLKVKQNELDLKISECDNNKKIYEDKSKLDSKTIDALNLRIEELKNSIKNK